MLDFGFYNMDCMEGFKAIKDGEIDLTLTDIPYDGVNLTRHKKSGKSIRETHKGNADVITFDLLEFLDEVWRVTKGTIIIFCGQTQVSDIFSYFSNKADCTVRQLIWKKTNPSPVNGEYIYLSGIENAIWVRKKGGIFNAFCKNTVFSYPCGNSDLHPTEKNHSLLVELINDNSNIGDTVFDPCAGSGSTLLIAHRLGRNYLGFELDTDYYKKAKARLDRETAQMTIFDLMEGTRK